MNHSLSIGDKFNPKFSYFSYDLTTEIHCFLMYIKKTNENTFALGRLVSLSETAAKHD